jgi:hypothetical protein
MVIAPASISRLVATTAMKADRCASPNALALYPSRVTDDSIAARAGAGGVGGIGGLGGLGGTKHCSVIMSSF